MAAILTTRCLPPPVHPSKLVLDKHYISVSESMGVKTRKYLGRFQGLRLTGRPYDQDAILFFVLPKQDAYSFVWNMWDEFYETD
jgi:hypothetical protein